MTFTSKSNASVSVTYLSYGAMNTTYISHIQLEEGDTATAFEPFYVTSSVNVTQEKDHVLKAIWQKNS